MRRKYVDHYSGIGGQAVIEGIMMKNKDMYSVAVRTENGDINVTVEQYDSIAPAPVLNRIPFVRGIFNFLDSLILGTRTLNYSASFYEEEDPGRRGKETTEAAGKFVSVITVIFSLAIAIALFMLLPYFLSQLVRRWIVNETVIAVIEGLIRIAIFVLYLVLISALKDIKRVFMYHGAEHKCINCLEHGLPLTIENVAGSSRQHKRCGTSFLFFVVFISVILFVFIRTTDPVMRIVLRVLLIPVIAGISYEIIRLAGRTNNPVISLLSAPGLMLQKLTTREPDASMIEVAIVAVDSVFDWKGYLLNEFGYDVNAMHGSDVKPGYEPEGNIQYEPAGDPPYGPEGDSPYDYEGNAPYVPVGNIPYGPEGNIQYGYNGNVPYEPEGNAPYIPDGNVPYGPDGNVPYVPDGNAAYMPEGNTQYVPDGNNPYGYDQPSDHGNY